MNKLTGIITLGLAALTFAPAAQARHHESYCDDGPPVVVRHEACSRRYVEYCRSCDGPAYIETYVAYYTRCGDPVYRTRVIPIEVCRPAPVVVRDCDRGPRVSVRFEGGWR